MVVQNAYRCKWYKRFKIRIMDLFDEVITFICNYIYIVRFGHALWIVRFHNSTKDLRNRISFHKSYHESSLLSLIFMIIQLRKSSLLVDINSQLAWVIYTKKHFSLMKFHDSNLHFQNWLMRHHIWDQPKISVETHALIKKFHYSHMDWFIRLMYHQTLGD